ncbi:uncharacterized protein J4E78_006035 [Alternaria triticimaculans]|uniref:uncharacterized protein n=1 Tax=Alternaria triticimaculans TaxID=297637 RepID=UPI0020C58CA2|nr:uncharacterized protein J4E78_006035 [Alternaria triticimaculans]KAI4657647.1 hypothetical protein J4E78_006035 [Alternaria triticimaculans]
MRIYSPTHELDFDYDPDGPSARFDDPNLPSCTAYGPDLFGELIGYEMLEAEVVAPWSLGELGYTNDAQHVHTDGRIESQQHLPDYYACSPHTDTWEDGLQDIESFDWASHKDDELTASELSNKNQGEEEVEATSVADTQCLDDQGQNAGPIEREAPNLSEKVDSPTTQPETPVKKPSKALLSDGIAIVLPESKTSAEHTHITSPASNLSPEREKTASHTNTLPHVAEKVESGLPAVDEKHLESPDLMDIDDLTIVAEAERLNIGPQMQDNVAAEEGPVETYPIPVLYDAEGNMLSELQSCSGSEDDKAAEASTIPLTSASSRHDSLVVHKSNLENSPQVDTASQKPWTGASMQPKSHVTSDEVQQTPHNSGIEYDEEAIQSALEALSRIQTQKDRLDDEEQLREGSAMQIEPAIEPLRLPPEALPELRDSPAHLKADEAPEVGSELTTFVLPDSSMITEGDSLGPKSPEALSRVQEDVEGPWQAQLRDAAAESLPSVLSEPLPPKDRDHSDPSISKPQEIAAGEASVQASPSFSGPTSELQLESNVALPPLPFPSEDEVRHEKPQISPDEENAIAAKLAHRLSKPPAPSDAEPDTAIEDNITVPDVDDSTSVAAIPEEDRMKDVSFAHNLDTTEDHGSTTAVAEPETQPVHPHKRSKASKNTASVSESDSDGPAKKKRKANVASLAKARAIKAANKKPSKALKDQENESTPPLAKGRRAAAKSKKEATHVDVTDEEPTLSTKHGGALKHAGSSAKAPIVVESDDAIISAQSDQGGDSADMDEHYSDVEKPVTPSKQTPAAEIVLGTPLSRPSVSKRELRDLTSTSYRQHPSKAKPISRKLFPPHKPNTLGELMSSMPASADSPTVSVSDTDSVGLPGDLGVPDTTTKAPKRPASKPRATLAKTARAKNGPAASGQTKKTPATRTTRKRNASPKKEAKTKSKDEEECVLFTEAQIETKEPSPEKDVPTPPRPLRRTTKQSILDEPEGDDDIHKDNNDPENEVEDDDDDFEDARETIEASADDSDEVDSDTPPPSKKLKLKNKPLTLDGHTIRQTRSRATTTPARNAASRAAAHAKNKFGFTPPLTRQAKKAANAPSASALAPAKPAPKAKGPAKSKVAPAPAKQPSVRKTRQASAMEEEDKVRSKRKLRSDG